MGTGLIIGSLYQSHGFKLDYGVKEMSIIGSVGAINNGWSRLFIA